MSLHEPGCAVDAHHLGPCLDDQGQPLPMGKPMPARPPFMPGPQPTKPGPYHATVRGPGGFDVNVSGDGDLFGRVLSAIGDTIGNWLED